MKFLTEFLATSRTVQDVQYILYAFIISVTGI